MSDTIILCSTEKGKILGGYTPLTFIRTETIKKDYNDFGEEYTIDYNESSFIFSVTENEKFRLENKYRAIKRYVDYSKIYFGNGELLIRNSAHIDYNYSTLAGRVYENPKFTDNEASYLKFNGNTSPNFRIKEWEVFQVEFY